MQQAAIVGGLKVDELVNRLRNEVGQGNFAGDTETEMEFFSAPPEWFNVAQIKARFDATPIINSGGSPMTEILALTKTLQPGELLELKTPFVPAPLLEILKEKGFNVYLVKNENEVISYLRNNKSEYIS